MKFTQLNVLLLLVASAGLSGVLGKFDFIQVAPVAFCLVLGFAQQRGLKIAGLVGAAALVWWNVLVPFGFARLDDLMRPVFSSSNQRERVTYLLIGGLGAIGLALILSIWDRRHLVFARMPRLLLLGAAGSIGFMMDKQIRIDNEMLKLFAQFAAWQVPVGMYLLFGALRRPTL